MLDKLYEITQSHASLRLDSGELSESFFDNSDSNSDSNELAHDCMLDSDH